MKKVFDFKKIKKNSSFNKRGFSEIKFKIKGKEIPFYSPIFDENTLNKAIKSDPMKEWIGKKLIKFHLPYLKFKKKKKRINGKTRQHECKQNRFAINR